MAFDRNGHPLKVGDVIHLPMRVESATEEMITCRSLYDTHANCPLLVTMIGGRVEFYRNSTPEEIERLKAQSEPAIPKTGG